MAKQAKFQKSAVANTVNNQVSPPSGLQMGQPVMLQTQMYQGPVPHPDILRSFNDLVPGTAERMISWAESESLHRRELESRSMDANIQDQTASAAMPFFSMICSSLAAAPPGCFPDAGDSHFCTVDVVTLS